MCWMLMHCIRIITNKSRCWLLTIIASLDNLTNSNHHWHTVVTAPHSILATVIGLFVRFRSWTIKLRAVNYSSKLQSPNYQGSWLSVVQCAMSLLYFVLFYFLKSLQSSLSTAIGTHLITYTTALFHLGKFGDDRHHVIRCRKEIFSRTSVLVRPVRRNIRKCLVHLYFALRCVLWICVFAVDSYYRRQKCKPKIAVSINI